MKKPSLVSIILLTVALSLTGSSVVLAQSKKNRKPNKLKRLKLKNSNKNARKKTLNTIFTVMKMVLCISLIKSVIF